MSFNNPTDVTHGVEVEADTLYEVGMGLVRLRRTEGLRDWGREAGSRSSSGNPAPTIP